MNETEPAGKVEAPPAFLEEAARAVRAHAPLRVESRRLIQRLRGGALLAVNEVREAVRALDTTARRWREVAERHGLPQVQLPPLPPSVQAPPASGRRLRVLARSWRERATRVLARRKREVSPGNEPPRELAPQSSPPAFELLLRLLAQRDSWGSLCFLNVGLPISLGLLWMEKLGMEWGGALLLCILGSLVLIPSIHRSQAFDVRGVLLWVLVWATSLGAPLLWYHSREGGWAPAASGSSLTVDGPQVSPQLKKYKSPGYHDDTSLEGSPRPDGPVKGLRLVALLLWALPNLLWLGWVLLGWRQELRQFRGAPVSGAAVSAQRAPKGKRHSRKRKKRTAP